MGPADKLNRTYEASNADVAAMRIQMTFTRNTKEGIPMSKFLTPEDVFKTQVKEFNKGNINFLMTLYEKDACFASEPGLIINDSNDIRQTLQSFINIGARLEAKVKRVIHASDLALLITEWSITGTEPADGTPISLAGRGTIVLRRQSDGTWLMIIENPWCTD
jgi:ketosteroid isomerase-like protein